MSTEYIKIYFTDYKIAVTQYNYLKQVDVLPCKNQALHKLLLL